MGRGAPSRQRLFRHRRPIGPRGLSRHSGERSRSGLVRIRLPRRRRARSRRPCRGGDAIFFPGRRDRPGERAGAAPFVGVLVGARPIGGGARVRGARDGGGTRRPAERRPCGGAAAARGAAGRGGRDHSGHSRRPPAGRHRLAASGRDRNAPPPPAAGARRDRRGARRRARGRRIPCQSRQPSLPARAFRRRGGRVRASRSTRSDECRRQAVAADGLFRCRPAARGSRGRRRADPRRTGQRGVRPGGAAGAEPPLCRF